MGEQVVAGAKKTVVDALCAQMSLRLMHHVQNVGRASVNMAKHCEISAFERKYLEDEDDEDVTSVTSSNSGTLALAALLPITAVLSFVVGKRVSKSRSQPAVEGQELE